MKYMNLCHFVEPNCIFTSESFTGENKKGVTNCQELAESKYAVSALLFSFLKWSKIAACKNQKLKSPRFKDCVKFYITVQQQTEREKFCTRIFVPYINF